MHLELLGGVEVMWFVVRVAVTSGRPRGGCGSQGEREIAAMERGRKYLCPLVLGFASGAGEYAFPITDTPYHADGSWGDWVCVGVLQRSI